MKNKSSFVSGNFNVIHNGHIRLFKFARSLSDKLIVGLYSDDIASDSVEINMNDRLEALKEINIIDEIVIIEKNLKVTLNQIKPDFIVKGFEFQNKVNEESKIIKGTKCQLVFSSGEVNLSINENEYNKKNNLFSIPNDYLLRHKINKKKIVSTINKFKKLKILVIGDLILDEFIQCSPVGMSRETNNIVYTINNKKEYIGGAGIVAAHAAAFGSTVNLISSCGKDKNGDFVYKKLKESNVNAHLVRSSLVNTIKKTRYSHEAQNLFRLNYLNKNLLNKRISNEIYRKFKKLSDDIDILIFSDFNYGCLDNDLVKKITSQCLSKKIMVCADSQSSSQAGDISQYQNCNLITPTELEARMSINDNKSGLIVLLEKLRNKTHSNNIILTLGKDGVLIHQFNNTSNKYFNDTIDALNKNPVNTSGAGDALLIGATCALKISNDIWLSSLIGSLMSAIQVSREGNLAISANDIINELNYK